MRPLVGATIPIASKEARAATQQRIKTASSKKDSGDHNLRAAMWRGDRMIGPIRLILVGVGTACSGRVFADSIFMGWSWPPLTSRDALSKWGLSKRQAFQACEL